ncbi:alpha/beta hydrolase family protein [Nocardia sp. NPDC020380]|uniref:alpha/beta hydrolase family protein n=1 Tax=Nocardia sp. NPDC020380 TaxID=3364309 RepID=UPI0037BCC65D
MADTSEMIKGLVGGMFTHPVRGPILRKPDEYGMAYQEISFPSLDGTPLEAWWIPAPGSDKLIVANHPLPMNRYGFASHLEPWKSMVPGGNDFEVNFMPEYKSLHDAGYNILTYDARNHGQSAEANGGIFTWGQFESRDVAGSLEYVKSRPDLRDMTLGLLSRCMGGNATYVAMARYPELFTNVRCMVNPQPVSLRVMAEQALAGVGIADQIGAMDREFQLITSFTMDQVSPIEYAKNCQVPTFIIQVRDDVLTRPEDVQAIFDAIPAGDKKLFWIEGSTARWDGYTYFPEHPEQLIEWFDKHMN